METLLLTLSPIVVAAISQMLKVVVDFLIRWSKESSIRTGFLRVLVAFLSLSGVVVSAALAGEHVDAMSIQTFAEAILVFLGASGTYFLTKKRKGTE